MKESTLLQDLQQRALEATAHYFNLARETWPDRPIPGLIYFEGTERPPMPIIPQCKIRFITDKEDQYVSSISYRFQADNGELATYGLLGTPAINYSTDAFVEAPDYMLEVLVPDLVAKLVVLAINRETGKRPAPEGKEWQEVMSLFGVNQHIIDDFADS